MKKFGVLHALVTAIIFTALYAVLLYFWPGPGFPSSMIATLNFSALFFSSLLVLIAYPFLYLFVYLISLFLFFVVRKPLMDADKSYIRGVCVFALLVFWIAMALGFVF